MWKIKNTKALIIIPYILVLVLLITGVIGIFLFKQYSQKCVLNSTDNQTETDLPDEDEVATFDYTGFVVKSFPITITIYGEEAGDNEYRTLNNEIKIPESWTYETYTAEDGTDLKDCLWVSIEDPEENIHLTIDPNVDGDMWPPQINNQVLVSTAIRLFNDSGIEVNILRNVLIDGEYYSYTENFSEGNETTRYADLFRVYSRISDSGTWGADVYFTLSLDIDQSKKNELIHTADAIVSSLEIVP